MQRGTVQTEGGSHRRRSCEPLSPPDPQNPVTLLSTCLAAIAVVAPYARARKPVLTINRNQDITTVKLGKSRKLILPDRDLLNPGVGPLAPMDRLQLNHDPVTGTSAPVTLTNTAEDGVSVTGVASGIVSSSSVNAAVFTF